MNSKEYTLYGDLDGMTVAELKEWLDQYPDDAVLDTYSDYPYPGSSEQEYFRFIWSETNDDI